MHLVKSTLNKHLTIYTMLMRSILLDCCCRLCRAVWPVVARRGGRAHSCCANRVNVVQISVHVLAGNILCRVRINSSMVMIMRIGTWRHRACGTKLLGVIGHRDGSVRMVQVLEPSVLVGCGHHSSSFLSYWLNKSLFQ